jgi:hypothetical protein
MIAVIRFIVLAVVVALIINMLTGGHLYRSGLFLVVILVILDIIKSQKNK